jgi:hypothetical protein
MYLKGRSFNLLPSSFLQTKNESQLSNTSEQKKIIYGTQLSSMMQLLDAEKTEHQMCP